MEINEILEGDESTTLEFKVEINDRVYKTISAFSNTEGGIFLGGVANDKEIVGFDCSENSVREVSNRVVNMGIQPAIDCVEVDGKNILVIKVSKSSIPITYRGRYYKRVGNTTNEMSDRELRDFLLRGTNWDGLLNEYSIDEIDETTVKKFKKIAVANRRMLDDSITDISEILTSLNLIIDGKLTNAALILFGKNPQKYFPNAVVRVLKCKNDVSSSDRTIKGNLFKQIEEAEEAIKNAINVVYNIKEELIREETWDYPLDAIREALANSIIHRDYFNYSIQTQIKIYNDHIWFFNPGNLFGGMTIEKLKLPHPSTTRNPLIAGIFFRTGIVEVQGSGMKRMLTSLKEVGIPEPDFKEEFDGFSVYMSKGYTEEMLKKIGLNERQIKAMLYISSNGSISIKEYLELIPEKSRGTLGRDLSDLVDRKLIKPVGPQKARRYEIMQSRS
ncbi:MAG: ATP-binding protein [Methanothermobacter sp.]